VTWALDYAHTYAYEVMHTHYKQHILCGAQAHTHVCSNIDTYVVHTAHLTRGLDYYTHSFTHECIYIYIYIYIYYNADIPCGIHDIHIIYVQIFT
jgi:hypothetical protein